MGLFSGWRKASAATVPAVNMNERAPEDLDVRSRLVEAMSQSDPNLALIFGGLPGFADEVVTLESAMEVPAIGSAVGFMSRSLASLPLKVYGKENDGRVAKPNDPVSGLLGRAANDETNAYEFRRDMWTAIFTGGRSINFIERNGRGTPLNLWDLDTDGIELERRNGRTLYHYRDGISRRVTYGAGEVIDIRFMPGPTRKSARSPIFGNRNTIGLAQAVTRYGAKFFANGGIPPFVIEGPVSTPGGVERAAAQLTEAVQKVAAENRNALVAPAGHKITPLGVDPEKMQMIEVQRFLVEQVARIYSIPPVFLQDLTHGTFSNTEQQDLHLAKHFSSQHCCSLEAELNFKLWGRSGGGVYCEHVLDGLLRGDIQTRVDASARRLATGQSTINEERALENKGKVTGGDIVMVQGAMVPAEKVGAAYGATAGDAAQGGEESEQEGKADDQE